MAKSNLTLEDLAVLIAAGRTVLKHYPVEKSDNRDSLKRAIRRAENTLKKA